jgi:hypothetical protein
MIAPMTKPPTMPTRPPMSKPPISKAVVSNKTFTIKPWVGSNEGEKIILYGASGIGKTTLAATAPNAVFIGVDDGARKIRNPLTGQPVLAIEGIETFADLRACLRTPNLFPAGTSLVIDTITQVQKLAEQYTFETVKVSGQIAKSLEDYGYGKGYRFLCETMRLLLTDMDPLVRAGVNIVLLAQDAPRTVKNPIGADWDEAGPELNATGNPNVRAEYCQWADHILRVAYPPANVRTTNSKATKGKVSGSYEQQIYAKGDLHFVAKNRMNGSLPDAVSFASPQDRSLWEFIFEGAKAASE